MIQDKLEILERGKIIDHVLTDLASLGNQYGHSNYFKYALDENITFFKSCRSLFQYLKWLFLRAPVIDREKILELTDFPLPRWDQRMHLRLIELQARKFPGLIKPLVDKISHFIY